MAVILNIETAADICSLSLSSNGETIKTEQSDVPHSHGSLIAVFADRLSAFAKSEGLELDAVAVSAGPGSYTGLRIGCSFAKGLCYGSGIPLIAIPTLKIMAAGLKSMQDCNDMLLCPMLDARRMEVYTALYDGNLEELMAPAPVIIDENSFSELYASKKICFFGNGAQKCNGVINRPDICFTDGINPLAEYMSGLSEQAYADGDFADLAYFEPSYLKEFMITPQKHFIV